MGSSPIVPSILFADRALVVKQFTTRTSRMVFASPDERIQPARHAACLPFFVHNQPPLPSTAAKPATMRLARLVPCSQLTPSAISRA
jgi:hypothetical protein